MKKLGIFFCVAIAVSLAQGLEIEEPSNLTVSIWHPIQAFQSFLISKVYTLIVDDGTEARSILQEIDEKIDEAANLTERINSNLEEKSNQIYADRIPTFVHWETGYELFTEWYGKGEAMREKYGTCLAKLKPRLEKYQLMESVTNTTVHNFVALHNGIARCTKASGFIGFFKSILCTARFGFCVLWKTFTLQNQPLYVPVTHKATSMKGQLKSNESCINKDRPDPVQLETFESEGETIVERAENIMVDRPSVIQT